MKLLKISEINFFRSIMFGMYNEQSVLDIICMLTACGFNLKYIGKYLIKWSKKGFYIENPSFSNGYIRADRLKGKYKRIYKEYQKLMEES